MGTVGEVVEELMGDKYKSQYKEACYTSSRVLIGVGTDQVRGKLLMY